MTWFRKAIGPQAEKMVSSSMKARQSKSMRCLVTSLTMKRCAKAKLSASNSTKMAVYIAASSMKLVSARVAAFSSTSPDVYMKDNGSRTSAMATALRSL